MSIEEAKKWFYSQSEFNTSALREKKEAGHRNYIRKINWEKAVNLVDKSKKPFISIPMEYEDENRPGIIYYDEKHLIERKCLKSLFIQW